MQALFDKIQPYERLGEIEQCLGLKIIANGPPQVFVGELCEILDESHRSLAKAEVLGFDKGKVYLMPLTKTSLRSGLKVKASGKGLEISLGTALLGRVLNAFAEPIDAKGKIPFTHFYSTKDKSINPLERETISEKLITGINTIDLFLPFGKGQRIGLFAGSGVGKSTLMGQIAEKIRSEVNVIALIGERGREVQDFISRLDENTLNKSVLIVACSDESALIRRQAVYTATTIAEFFCQQGKDVMLFMDSVTRFAMAEREISLSLGEPPTSRGYTPSVFAKLPSLVERAGNFKGKGSISAIYTVLVEGDDFNEPVADNLRALLDGHILLTRELAEAGHFPAISILQSVSRLASQLLSPEEQSLRKRIVTLLADYQQHKDLITLGAYKKGTNPNLDQAIEAYPSINKLLENKNLTIEEVLASLQEIAA